MLTTGINFLNFNQKNRISNITKKYSELLKENNMIVQSLSKNYKDSFNKKIIKKYVKKKNYRLFGMGGSTLGAQTIYSFLNHKIKKNFEFFDNLQPNRKLKKNNYTNLIISKSGNTVETIANVNVFVKKTDENIIITENKKNYLFLLAEKLKADVIHHNNFIGGRYSVLSEVGMLPAELMGLNSNHFRQFNSLVKNKKFVKNLLSNVATSIYLINKKKFNSVIINYDEKSEDLFKWYQQLVSESLGKKKKGILPIVSNMPKDNHSVMQLYLDGFQNNFYTFFIVNENNPERIKNKDILSSHNFLKNKNLFEIILAQKNATEIVFKKKKIPYRSFEIQKRDEKTLGELFCFFILETILIGKCLNINPYNQPAVELIKKETSNLLG